MVWSEAIFVADILQIWMGFIREQHKGAIMDKNQGKELQTRTIHGSNNLPSEKSITLNTADVLDLTGLKDDQIQELKKQHASGMIDLQKKAAELKIDVGALDSALSSFTDQTLKATQSGAHATITHSQTSALGRTEVVIGNTDRAAAGKLSRSAVGEKDKILWIVGIIAAVVIVIAIILGGR